MRVELKPLFGKIPADTPNLEAGGVFDRRFEEMAWATVWPGSGLIRWADGSIETETIWVENNLKDCGDYHSRWSWFPKRRRGHFFNLSLFWWPNYYHWLCDVLPRLHDVLLRLTPDIQVILPPGLAGWQQHTLDWIGLSRNQCVPYSERRPWKVERLLYVSPVLMTANHEPKTLFWTRDRILQGCLGKSEVPLGQRRLYISRRQAARRKIINEADLLPVLEKYGFENIECESLSFDKQVRTFSEAAVVVGAHGAGLTNALWCGQATRFFEIFEPTSVRICYWSLARTLGHHYACCIADKVSNNEDEPNMHVNTESFESALKDVCNGLQQSK
jgi:capsular polysaccharide biosynthesis protein